MTGLRSTTKISVVILVSFIMGVLATQFIGDSSIMDLVQSNKFDYVQEIDGLQEQLNSISAERDHRLEHSEGLEESLQQATDWCESQSDEMVELQVETDRLKVELRKANKGKDVWPCGTLKDLVEEPKLTFPELVEEVLDGVVHIKMDNGGQASGFVIGPRLIKTARHVTKGRVGFTLTTNGGHVIKATRAISHKGHDVAYIYIDDLTCVAEAAEDISCRKGGHEVELKVLELGSIKDCKLGQEIFSIGSTGGIANFNAVAKGTIQTLDSRLAEHIPQVQGMGWDVLFGMTPEGGGGNSGCPVFTMDGKVVGIWVGSNQPNLHYAIPVDVTSADIEAVMLMFTINKYQIEKPPDTRMGDMRTNMANLQQQLSYSQADIEELMDMYEWFLENKEAVDELCEIEELEKTLTRLIIMVENITQSVTLREYLNL